MMCPKCGGCDYLVQNTRPCDMDGKKSYDTYAPFPARARQYKCKTCGENFNTIEIDMDEYMTMRAVKKLVKNFIEKEKV